MSYMVFFHTDAVCLSPGPATTRCHFFAAALQQNNIRGAGLDVVATEPLPAESPLWELDNVLLSPHSADRTMTFQFEAVQQFVNISQQYLSGKELPNQIDKHHGY